VPDHLKGQSQSALDTPAVPICSLVVKGRKKASQQVVAMRAVKLNGVATGFLGSSSSLAKLLYDLLDLINRQLLRDLSINARWDGRGGHGLNSRERRPSIKAWMNELGCNLSAKRVNGLNQLPPFWNKSIFTKTQIVPQILGTDGCILGDDQSHSSTSAQGIMIYKRWGHPSMRRS
jgi:hypothetical protein